MSERNVVHPDVSTTELHQALEAVLIEKGASPEWIEYAIHDLRQAAVGYARSLWAAGHKAGEMGYPIPNPQPDP